MSSPSTRRFFRHGFLPQLLAFEACLRTGSVTRAAEELSVAQPTISGMLRKLSETLGAPLLRPQNGRMEPTDAGRDVERLCAEIRDCLIRFEERRVASEIDAAVQVRARMMAYTRASLGVHEPAKPRSSALPRVPAPPKLSD
jgi:molybdenum-dependent DNA-binding transcriptional regulator ModE